MIASGEPLELVLMPLLILRIKLPLLRLASKISESLSIFICPSKPRSCGVTLPSKSENDSCCPSTGPSKIIFTMILSVDEIIMRSSPESSVVTS